MRRFLPILLCLLLPQAALALSPLQILVDITPQGGVVKPLPGTYVGPVVISKAVTLDGMGEVVVDGDGKGSVLTIKADGVTVRGLHITNSGNSHDAVDAGVAIEGNDNLVEGNQIDDVLFGVHLKKAIGNRISGNQISSRGEDPTVRGEGVRAWYSSENLIENNTMTHIRDLVFANSPDNRIIGNQISEGRIGMEFIFSPDNEVADNSLRDSITGIVVLYSDGLHIHHNKIHNLRNITGFGLSIKESSRARVEGNQILHCAIGMVVNAPVQPENVADIRGNLLAYNDAAMFFFGEKGGHRLGGNSFISNHTDVLVSSSSSANGNDWTGNYWDQYEGFDLDADGIGDRPYQMYIYSDRLWMDRPKAKFFRGTPGLELVDLIERLAPFKAPELILEDNKPLIKRPE